MEEIEETEDVEQGEETEDVEQDEETEDIEQDEDYEIKITNFCVNTYILLSNTLSFFKYHYVIRQICLPLNISCCF